MMKQGKSEEEDSYAEKLQRENLSPSKEESEEEDLLPPPPQTGGRRFKDGKLAKTKIVLSTVWSSETTTTGRWRLRASLRSTNESHAPDILSWRNSTPTAGYFAA